MKKSVLFTMAIMALPLLAQESNLFKNPDFRMMSGKYITDWKTTNSARQADATGKFFIRGTAKSYMVMSQKVNLKVNKKYKLTFEARKVGGEAKFGVLMLGKQANGSFREISPYLAWKSPLTENFKKYEFTFTAKYTTQAVCFYRLGDKNSPAQVDYTNLVLTEL